MNLVSSGVAADCLVSFPRAGATDDLESRDVVEGDRTVYMGQKLSTPAHHQRRQLCGRFMRWGGWAVDLAEPTFARKRAAPPTFYKSTQWYNERNTSKIYVETELVIMKNPVWFHRKMPTVIHSLLNDLIQESCDRRNVVSLCTKVRKNNPTRTNVFYSFRQKRTQKKSYKNENLVWRKISYKAGNLVGPRVGCYWISFT